MRRVSMSDGGALAGLQAAGRPGRTVALLVLLAVAAQAAAQPPKPARLPPAPVVVATVQKRPMAAGRTFVGTVKPLRIATVGSPVADKVVEFSVHEGDHVKKGDPLAQLRTETLEIDLRAAEAELALRQQELIELLNGSRPEEIWEADAQLAAAGSLMEYMSQRLGRTKRLIQQDAATADELQEQTSAAEGASKTFEAKLAAWLLAVAGPRKEKIEQAWARVAMQDETVKRLEDEKEQHTVRAPFDGYVSREYTEVGQWIAVGAPVVDLVELDSVYVEVPVLETYIANVAKAWGDKEGVPVRLNSLPDRLFQGTVDRMIPQADSRSRSFPVKVRLSNEEVGNRPLLQPGMMAWVTLPVGDPSEVTAVPKDALVLGEGLPKIWVIVDPAAQPPGHLRQVSVKVLQAERGWIGVEGDVHAGERVIVEGNERINPMQPIRVVESVGADGKEPPRPATK